MMIDAPTKVYTLVNSSKKIKPNGIAKTNLVYSNGAIKDGFEYDKDLTAQN